MPALQLLGATGRRGYDFWFDLHVTVAETDLARAVALQAKQG
jgi:hypothetical protein